MIYNIDNSAIQWQMEDCLSEVNCNVCFFPVLTCKNRHLKSLTLTFLIEGNEVQPLYHLIAYINLYKSCSSFTLTLTVLKTFTFQN